MFNFKHVRLLYACMYVPLTQKILLKKINATDLVTEHLLTQS